MHVFIQPSAPFVTEHYFGGGINIAPAGQTHFGSPLKTIPLGYTSLPTDVREALLEDLRERFTAQSYSLLSFNCNTFSNEFSQLLIGKGIPQDILELPDLVMSTPFGEMMRPTLATLEQQLGSVQGPDVSAQQEVDAAIGGGMIEDYRFHSQLGSDERLALELAVAQEFDVLLANGMPEHEAQAVALERISNSRRGH